MSGSSNTEIKPGIPFRAKVWLCAAMVSTTGSISFTVALAWAATAHGGAAAGITLTAGILPQASLLLVGGALADRAGPRRVMGFTLCAMTLNSLLLAAAATVFGTQVWLLAAFSLITGLINAFHLPSVTSIMRRLVAPEQLSRALAVQQAGRQVAGFVGAPLGGVLTVGFGISGAAIVNASSFVLTLIVLTFVRPPFEPPGKGKSAGLIHEASDGLKLAAKVPLLRIGLSVMAGGAAFIAPITILFVPLLARMRGWSPHEVGWLLGAQDVVFFVVALITSRYGASRRPGIASAAGITITGVGAVILSISPVMPLALTSAALVGLGYGIAAIHLAPLVIQSAPESHTSRISAMITLAQSLGVISSVSGFGMLGEIAGPVIAATANGALLVSVGLLAFTSRHFSAA
ncbi:MFS transporter [Nonomuraea sp. NPDC005650]|uniref:MFS transporter n=1 Tax=Nonomuraea sp. NPDC005650 TaxID=3157045 RepID=UPI0033BE13EB